MGYGMEAVEESLRSCKNDLLQSHITLHKLAVATTMHGDVDIGLIWTPPFTPTICKYSTVGIMGVCCFDCSLLLL
jgi:hypothetical protein